MKETKERARSLWGWGYADKFPDDDTRRGVGAHAAALLGVEPFVPEAPPTIDSITLSEPRIDVPEELSRFVTNDKLQRASHTYGRSYRDVVRGFHGDFKNAPDLVAKPTDEADIAAILEWASRELVAVIPYGGGTSVVAGTEADLAEAERYVGAVCLDLRGMDRVLEVDPISRAARIEAGALGPRIEEQLAPHGFTLRHFPQSFEHSTLGGWLATRAGGHFATVYTHIDDLVQSIRMVTPTGVFASRRLPASGAGPAPDRLVLGSEGILGVITEAWMRVQVRPRWRASASVQFAEFKAAVAAARDIAQSGLFPANCRLLDDAEAKLNGVVAMDEKNGNVLVLGFESADHPCDAWIERAVAIAQSHGGVTPKGIVKKDGGEKAKDEGGAAAWRAAFLEAPYLQSTLVSLGVLADTFETACTWDTFDRVHEEVVGRVTEAMKSRCGGGRITCRFTHVYPDGPAPYFTFLAPGGKGLDERLERWWTVKRAASDALERSGATITHHHAVGRVHRPWYDRERPEPFAVALKAAKRALDPAGVLNPGVLIDP